MTVREEQKPKRVLDRRQVAKKEESIANICSVSMLSMFMDIDTSCSNSTNCNDSTALDSSFSSTMFSTFMKESVQDNEPTKSNKTQCFIKMLIYVVLIFCMSVGIAMGVLASQATTFSIYKGDIAMSRQADIKNEFPLNMTHQIIPTDYAKEESTKEIPMLLFDPDHGNAIVPNILSKCFDLKSISLQSFLNKKEHETVSKTSNYLPISSNFLTLKESIQ